MGTATTDYTVTVEKGTFAQTGWGNYGALAVGEDPITAPMVAGLNPPDGTKSYKSTTEGVCTVETATGELTPVTTGTCGIELTISLKRDMLISSTTILLQSLLEPLHLVTWAGVPRSIANRQYSNRCFGITDF